MLTAPLSTLRICSCAAWSAMGKPRPGLWRSNKFLNPASDGVVLPILHLNGYKIANPTVLARIPKEELHALLEGYGHRPHFVEGDDPTLMHQLMAETLDNVLDQIAEITSAARAGRSVERAPWPMIVLRTPKGWTGPKEVDGVPVEGTHRSHQVPLANVRGDPRHLAALEEWMRSYRPEELFGPDGSPADGIAGWSPSGDRRMSANPRANGGMLLRDLVLPDFLTYAVDVTKPGTTSAEATRVLGEYLRDVIELNARARNFRIFGPDETASNRLGAVFEATGRTWQLQAVRGDEHLSRDGRVMEVLSEHMCQGWLEGYLLTGRHGLFNCYE